MKMLLDVIAIEKGGHLLFRPVGLLITAHVVRQAKDSGLPKKEAIKRISEISMELTDEPWVGLLWDKTKRRMISTPPPERLRRNCFSTILAAI